MPHSLELVGLSEPVGAFHNCKNRDIRTENLFNMIDTLALSSPRRHPVLRSAELAVPTADSAALVADG
jgi:hypothetical protein